MGGLVALLSVAVVLSCLCFVTFFESGTAARSEVHAGLTELLHLDRQLALASLGGCLHFLAYLSTLCAFSCVSSTVITPLMQLSAVWMLPCSIFTASIGQASMIRPLHLLSVFLIC